MTKYNAKTERNSALVTDVLNGASFTEASRKYHIAKETVGQIMRRTVRAIRRANPKCGFNGYSAAEIYENRELLKQLFVKMQQDT